MKYYIIFVLLTLILSLILALVFFKKIFIEGFDSSLKSEVDNENKSVIVANSSLSIAKNTYDKIYSDYQSSKNDINVDSFKKDLLKKMVDISKINLDKATIDYNKAIKDEK